MPKDRPRGRGLLAGLVWSGVWKGKGATLRSTHLVLLRPQEGAVVELRGERRVERRVERPHPRKGRGGRLAVLRAHLLQLVLGGAALGLAPLRVGRRAQPEQPPHLPDVRVRAR
eukprot:scaffold78635_cov57-Phaeocystis_antarctica.AAC.2